MQNTPFPSTDIRRDEYSSSPHRYLTEILKVKLMTEQDCKNLKRLGCVSVKIENAKSKNTLKVRVELKLTNLHDNN